MKSEQLHILEQEVKSCTKCEELNKVRTNYVFGEGNPGAEVVFCGEASGKNEDLTGRPFVGRAGKLLDNIIKSCGWTREEIYILNTIKCRPPDNRTPTHIEISNCSGFLDKQLAIINPKYVICLGTTATQRILNTDKTITSLRGVLHNLGKCKVLATYHPSFLLRQPKFKAEVWNDLQILLNDIKCQS